MGKEFLIKLIKNGNINKLQEILKEYTLSLSEIKECQDGALIINNQEIPRGPKKANEVEKFINKFESENFETCIINNKEKDIFIQLYYNI